MFTLLYFTLLYTMRRTCYQGHVWLRRIGRVRGIGSRVRGIGSLYAQSATGSSGPERVWGARKIKKIISIALRRS